MNEQKTIKNKVGLLKLAQQPESVSKACKVMGFSRDSSCKPVLKNCVSPKIESAVVEFALEQPCLWSVKSL